MLHVYEDQLSGFELKGNLKEDVYRFLVHGKCPKTAEHCMKVGEEAGRLARIVGTDPAAAEAAGYLHDVSAVYPNDRRIPIAIQLGIDVLPEEEVFPLIVHQKISKAMAEHIFGIKDVSILNAVGCHTTLKAHSSLLDKVLFVADKIEWDQQGTPPYITELLAQLDISLDHAAFAYIDYLCQRKETLKVVHPWLRDAHEELKRQLF
ncbi:bis(5'-nucleosyl)-tetraphosphatase (symmetrical) YqeK [Paenibacillus allorhizosphaerae]|nr:bis(5'-nucleosyl)-tetraphosphatase (symmetrical) YqeK [Paenibacillus allorhizosphaerae]